MKVKTWIGRNLLISSIIQVSDRVKVEESRIYLGRN